MIFNGEFGRYVCLKLISTPQSDNGSEFKAEFTQAVLDDGAVRWLTYPKNPKMNAHAERFNRTIQE